MDCVIKVDNLTKDFKNGKGVFNVSFDVKDGEIFGLLGPNGAGKTTIIRHLLGFLKSDCGATSILDRDCWGSLPSQEIGYLPGEISVPNELTAKAYLSTIAQMRKLTDLSKMKALIERFDLDVNMHIKRMSKGNKQKVAIVAAFMHDPRILILDEPTSGLDPLMQKELISLVIEEKANGKTVLFSSHIFDEIEKACDRICFLKQGKIVDIMRIDEIRKVKFNRYDIEFATTQDADQYIDGVQEFLPQKNENIVSVSINNSQLNDFVKSLSAYNIVALHEQSPTLEDYFMQIYQEEGGAQ